jgi:4-amino-4-deoxy-L-arabinose transferase-like glycosyltransferase
LRLASLDLESFWFDEARTAEIASRSTPVGVLREVWAGESTPPLYFLVMWVWQHLIGNGDYASRLVSALCGIATVPVAYAIGARLDRPRTGVVAAGLVAFSPLLLHYSQENRPYAALSFLGALSVLLLLRALERPSTQRLAAWAVCCMAAIATHYFAGFLVAPEVAVLLWRARLARPALLASAAVAAGALVVAPVGLHQQSLGRADFVTETPLGGRLREAGNQFAKGVVKAPWAGLGVAAVVLVAVAVLLLLSRRSEERRRAALPLGLGAAAVAVPVLLALVGLDAVLWRNLIVAWVPLAVGLSMGFAASRAGLLAAVGLMAVWAAIWVGILTDDAYHRDDWRGAMAKLGPATSPRVVEVLPGYSAAAVARYGGPLALLGARTVRTDDVVMVGGFLAHDAPGKLVGVPGFRLRERHQVQRIGLARYRAPVPRVIRGRSLDRGDIVTGVRTYVELTR